MNESNCAKNPVALVTGGAGFIGSNFVIHAVNRLKWKVVNLDLLTYCGSLENLDDLEDCSLHQFVHGDIRDEGLVRELLREHRPDYIINFAAETHVDRSISGPGVFIDTNVCGVRSLLDALVAYCKENDDAPRFLQISTDEVFGALEHDDPAFTEDHPYQPSSPYSASKAAADHLVRAYHRTFHAPVLITNCSNNYGPAQFPEKLIPLVISRALNDEYLPIYGDGSNIRDWLHVSDHCRAIELVLRQGRPGASYNIGGDSERTNLCIVETICSILDELHPRHFGHYRDLIRFVGDRPGHDFRYAINASRIRQELGFTPQISIEDGLRSTVEWYLDRILAPFHLKARAV